MSDQIQNVKKLLSIVAEKIERSKEISRLKGENFNVFSILGFETKENKTHSRFLASLLDPNGDHGLGDIFLQLFYKTILSNETEHSLTENKQEIVKLLMKDIVEVRTEEYLGKINNEEETGGFVDVSLTGNNGKIFIENKINAGDQHLQIARYINGSNLVVFYLTLDGRRPSKGSSGNYKVNEDFFLLSYKTDIKNWLEDCQKEVSDFPIIRETIKQYLILIKKLTGQLNNQEMEKEILELIKNNIEVAEKIGTLLVKAKFELGWNRYSKILDMLKGKLIGLNIDLSGISRERSNRLDGCFIKIIGLNNYDIGINLELSNNYFFFCAVQKNKKRQPSINTRSEFDNLSSFLINNLKKHNINVSRNGWRLAGIFTIMSPFDNNMNDERSSQIFCTDLANQIKDIIDKSDIYNFNKSK